MSLERRLDNATDPVACITDGVTKHAERRGRPALG
jgi:hypothetical protein